MLFPAALCAYLFVQSAAPVVFGKSVRLGKKRGERERGEIGICFIGLLFEYMNTALNVFSNVNQRVVQWSVDATEVVLTVAAEIVGEKAWQMVANNNPGFDCEHGGESEKKQEDGCKEKQESRQIKEESEVDQKKYGDEMGGEDTRQRPGGKTKPAQMRGFAGSASSPLRRMHTALSGNGKGVLIATFSYIQRQSWEYQTEGTTEHGWLSNMQRIVIVTDRTQEARSTVTPVSGACLEKCEIAKEMRGKGVGGGNTHGRSRFFGQACRGRSETERELFLSEIGGVASGERDEIEAEWISCRMEEVGIEEPKTREMDGEKHSNVPAHPVFFPTHLKSMSIGQVLVE
ncbi:hypothetical protein B0H13DRAFT_1936103 [Mycena leptocephala]|nr:hypothetical protein B0H13DRAFT_1936103 [Mycena leptocephala]